MQRLCCNWLKLSIWIFDVSLMEQTTGGDREWFDAVPVCDVTLQLFLLDLLQLFLFNFCLEFLLKPLGHNRSLWEYLSLSRWIVVHEHICSWLYRYWLLLYDEFLVQQLGYRQLATKIVLKDLLMCCLLNSLVIELIPLIFESEIGIVVTGLSFETLVDQHGIQPV